MARLATEQISANYDDDAKLLEKYPVVEVAYEDGKFLFTLNIGEDDHYATFTFDEDDINHSMIKAKKEASEEA